MTMRAVAMVHDVDPKTAIMEKLAPLVADIEPLGARVLVAQYVRPQKTVSGLYLPDKTRDEDIYQGKVGIVLKLGPLAFVDDEQHHWGDSKPRVGDWVMYRVGDAWPFIVGDHTCRHVEDVSIQAIVGRPDTVL